MNAIVPHSQTNADAYRASTDAAGLCRDIVVKTALTIQNRKYVRVEGWQAIAIAHGCTGSACDVEAVDGGVRAVGEIRRMSDGAVIATAEGFVGEDEPTWYGGEITAYGKTKTLPKRPDYAIRAMAQTRAISRACRSAFAHVVVLMDAGLSTTPAEEVPDEGFGDMRNVTPEPEPRSNVEPLARKSSAQAKRDGDWDLLTKEIKEQRNEDELTAWAKRRSAQIKALPRKWYDELLEKYNDRLNDLRAMDDEPSEAEREMDEEYTAVVSG